MRHGRQDGRTSIVALGCEVSSCLTRRLVEAVVCLPTDDQVIGGCFGQIDDGQTQFQTSMVAGKQSGAWTCWASTRMIASCISSSVRRRRMTEGDRRDRDRRMVEDWTRGIEEGT
jgi:hypothetical protein